MVSATRTIENDMNKLLSTNTMMESFITNTLSNVSINNTSFANVEKKFWFYNYNISIKIKRK